MTCPQCHLNDDRITNTSASEDGRETVRRHHCQRCQHRWTTRELYAARLTSPIPPTKRSVAGTLPRRPVRHTSRP